MKHLSAVVFGVLLCLASQAAAENAAPEFRAMWCTRFDWPSGDRATIQARIDSIMQDLADHGFDAVFFQIRGQADVFYPSPYEPWSPLINGGVDPGWDPVAYAINAAHARGIEFHAYMNTHTCWLSGSQQAPANTSHLYYQHCNAADPDHRDWLIHDSAGNPVQWGESVYVWMSPGVPAYQAYVRQQILYVVQTYDVDGIHYDRIRTPSSSYSHDPISEARRINQWSNPNSLDFDLWMDDQITRHVRDMYAAIADLKPNLRISAAVFANAAVSPTSVHQDTLTWLATGGLDTAVPMAYSSGGAGTAWDTSLQHWVANSAGRHVVMGHNTGEGIAMLLEQVALTRTRGGHGNSAYTWGTFSTSFWDEYLNNVYQAPASPPTMPWKTASGIITGFVRTAPGLPVVDAHVTRDGSTYTGLSSGDGFYSLLLVPPGTYTLTASHPNHGSATATVTVTAGSVAHADFTLPLNLPPVLAPVSPDPGAALTEIPYTCQLTLTQGLADTFTILQGPRGAKVGPGGLVSWTPVLADAGTSVTFTVRAANTAGSDEVTWRVGVSRSPLCTPMRLADFENTTGSRVMFQNPRYSSSTNLTTTPDIARVTTTTAYSGGKSYEIQWQWLDTAPGRWLRLTTNNAPVRPNPTVDLRRPIRLRLRLDSGSLRLCVGLRETNTTAAIGADGSTSGTIEWLGATAVVSGAPQGVLVQAQPGVWQTFTFNPLTDPIRPFTGDGTLATGTGKGTLEELAFAPVDSAGPFTIYLDDVDLICRTAPYGDYDGDGWVDLTDLGRFTNCLLGPTLDQLDPLCGGVDSDGDLDVDAEDFGRLQRCLNTAAPQDNPQCGDP